MLGLFVTPAVPETWVMAQQVPLSAIRAADDLQDALPFTSAAMTQILPVYQLEQDAFSQDLTAERNQSRQPTDTLETPVSDLTAPSFSPTVSVHGETVVGMSGASGRDLEDSMVLQSSVELILQVSFAGEDQLQVGLESGNATEFPWVDELTFEGRLTDPASTDGDRVELSELSYEFPIGDRASLYLSTTGDDLDDFNPVLTDDVISEFGTENPINNLVEDTGLQLNYDLSDRFNLSLGYFTGASDTSEAVGLFDGNQSAFVQLGIAASDDVVLGLTYIYNDNDASLETETGSGRSQIDLERPVIGNSYGLSASFSPSSQVAIGGWVGFTQAMVLGLGTADIWNYALTLAVLDVGQPDNLLGLVIGQEPRLTGTSGFKVDDLSHDPDTSFHIELFYRYHLSDPISVTPGLIWITAPNHDNSNPDIVIFTVRTKFEF